MRQIEAWETEDGTICASKVDALRHEFTQKHYAMLGASAVAYVLGRADEIAGELADIVAAMMQAEQLVDVEDDEKRIPGPFDGYKPKPLADGPWAKPADPLGAPSSLAPTMPAAPKPNCNVMGKRHDMNAVGYCNECGARA